MKKTLSALLAAVMMVTLVACQSSTTDTDTTSLEDQGL